VGTRCWIEWPWEAGGDLQEARALDSHVGAASCGLHSDTACVEFG
jgi:hypothetical protein